MSSEKNHLEIFYIALSRLHRCKNNLCLCLLSSLEMPIKINHLLHEWHREKEERQKASLRESTGGISAPGITAVKSGKRANKCPGYPISITTNISQPNGEIKICFQVKIKLNSLEEKWWYNFLLSFCSQEILINMLITSVLQGLCIYQKGEIQV